MSCTTEGQLYVGGRVYIQFTTKSGGTLLDITTAVVTVKLPDGSEIELTLAADDVERVSSGTYRAAFIPSQSGRHFWRVGGPGRPNFD